jgi:hypothetical protein
MACKGSRLAFAQTKRVPAGLSVVEAVRALRSALVRAGQSASVDGQTDRANRHAWDVNLQA